MSFTFRLVLNEWFLRHTPLTTLGPPDAQSPFACSECYSLQGGVTHHLEGRYPFVLAPTGSCARPPPSTKISCPHLYSAVFAGCCQPLLGDGPSRRYLCKSVPGCLGHDPGGSSGARACFFPDVIGLPQVPPIGRLPASIRSRDFRAEGVSRSSPFLPFRPPGLFATQVSPTATASSRRAAVTFPSEQNLCRCLHRHRIC